MWYHDASNLQGQHQEYECSDKWKCLPDSADALSLHLHCTHHPHRSQAVTPKPQLSVVSGCLLTEAKKTAAVLTLAQLQQQVWLVKMKERCCGGSDCGDATCQDLTVRLPMKRCVHPLEAAEQLLGLGMLGLGVFASPTGPQDIVCEDVVQP